MPRSGLALALLFAFSCSEKLELGARERLIDAGVGDTGAEDAAADAADDATVDAEAATCEPGTTSTTPVRPVDIIFVLDNSSSMADSVAGIESGLPSTFAPALDAAGVDYRVIVLSRYGRTALGDSDFPLCIAAPLGTTDCSDPDNQPLAHNPPRFYQFSAEVTSDNALCVTLQALTQPDELPPGQRAWTPIAPNGYGEFLRPEAFKTFVLVTDADASCSYGGLTFVDGDEAQSTSSAVVFDQALLAASPENFGTAEARRYEWHSVTGIDVAAPLEPAEPLTTSDCSSEALLYQAISRQTGGTRLSLCSADLLGQVFSTLAAKVIERAQHCE